LEVLRLQEEPAEASLAALSVPLSLVVWQIQQVA